MAVAGITPPPLLNTHVQAQVALAGVGFRAIAPKTIKPIHKIIAGEEEKNFEQISRILISFVRVDLNSISPFLTHLLELLRERDFR